ncbi:MAG TPA: family 20 glycosylhydrolase [Bryobacteraceae bacterium]|nr:family 20 glycosylhydrolase [Bryobacteraceae bacterium]
MPEPVKVVQQPGYLAIDSGFHAAIGGYSDARLQAALARFESQIARQTGLPISPSGDAKLQVTCQEGGSEYPTLGEDESYQLDVSASDAKLQARTVTGALRGLETFAQLIAPGPDGFQIPAVHIEDRPRFPWRGLMMDVSRHWMPLAVVERNLDAMAAVKLNVFHWHLSDDQGFRVESKVYPRLQQEGSDGHYYTQAQVREVVNYARDRGIRVIPEFDMPGHTSSWFVGYPALASAPGPYAIERHFGVFEPVMDPTREETYTFLDGFIGEMASLFPDPYFHIGGDEVKDDQWKHSAAIQAFMRAHHIATSRDLQAYFNHRVQELLKKHGKIMIGWDEVLVPGLASETVIQSWRGQKSVAEAVSKGYRSLLSWGYYLDHLQPASYHYAVDPMQGDSASLTPEQASRILGGEACMWAEYVDAETVDSRIWPRMAAIAERFWSPRDVTSVDSMYSRLPEVSRWLEWTGLRHRSNEGPMLDRLAGGEPSAPLRVLADASEALGFSGRRKAQKYTSLTPLNRFVDAAHPESPSVRRLENAVAALGTNPLAAAELRATMVVWAQSAARLQPLLANNGLLAEVAPLAQNLATAGKIGLRALDYLEHRQTPPAGWVNREQQELDRIDQPVAEVRLAAVRPVRMLLQALNGQSAAARRRDAR